MSSSNHTGNAAHGVDYFDGLYDNNRRSTPAEGTETGPAGDDTHPDAPQVQDSMIDPRLLELDRNRGPRTGAASHSSRDMVGLPDANLDASPPSFVLFDPMIDQAMGAFVPYAAANRQNYDPLSDSAPNAAAYRPEYNQERSGAPFFAEGSRSPDIVFDPTVPSFDPNFAGYDSPPPVEISEKAAGKRKASDMVESSTEPGASSLVNTGKRKRTKGNSTGNAKPAFYGQVAHPDWTKGDGLREPSPAIKPSGLYYDSFAEAESKMNHPNWSSPADDTVPTTAAELTPYVLQLTTAMKDLTQFQDSLNTKVVKRWLDVGFRSTGIYGPVLTNDFYMPHLLEWLAWRIATMIQQLHLGGPGTVQCQDPLILESSFIDKDLTFEARMAIFVDVCRLRKSRVMLMLDGGELERYVLTPSTILSGSETNAEANSRRADIIKEGIDTWKSKNPSKAQRKTTQSWSRRGSTAARGGLSKSGRKKSKAKLPSEQESDDLAEDIAEGLPQDEGGRLSGRADQDGAYFALEEGGFGRADNEDAFDDEEAGDYIDKEEALSPVGKPAQTEDDSDDSVPDSPRPQVRRPRTGAHANYVKNKDRAAAPLKDDAASAVAKGKRKAQQDDDNGGPRPRRKSARETAVPRETEYYEDDDTPAPYVGKGKGKAAAKGGRQK